MHRAEAYASELLSNSTYTLATATPHSSHIRQNCISRGRAHPQPAHRTASVPLHPRTLRTSSTSRRTSTHAASACISTPPHTTHIYDNRASTLTGPPHPSHLSTHCLPLLTEPPPFVHLHTPNNSTPRRRAHLRTLAPPCAPHESTVYVHEIVSCGAFSTE